MNPITTFEELRSFNLINCYQYWYYIILVNPKDITKAGQALFDNLNIFHLDSGEDCHYFIPGFENTGTGLFRGLLHSLDGSKNNIINIPGFGNLKFFEQDFVEFYRGLESLSDTGWRYSGECELLLFNINSERRIELDDFASYNLDDIIRNGRNISEFIRTTINVGKDAFNQDNAKCLLDEKFYEMIMPDKETVSSASYKKGWDILFQNGFVDNSYYFISYSTKDYCIVSEIRNKLCNSGIKCWMAPFDIPNGTNYAWIIEHAIQHTGKFVLILSENSVESVWVGKELKRAITLFQRESPDKLCVVWLNREFSLIDTPLALPLEDIQMSVNLEGNSENYFLIVDSENKVKSKTIKHMTEIERLLSPANSIENLTEILDHIHALPSQKLSFIMKRGYVYDICQRIKREIDYMKQTSYIYEQDYLSHYYEAVNLIKILMEMLTNQNKSI